MILLPIAVLAASFARAALPPELEELHALNSRLETARGSVISAEKSADEISQRWGQIFRDGIRSKRKDPFDFPQPPWCREIQCRSDEDMMFEQWMYSRRLSDPSKDEWEWRQEWSRVRESLPRDYELALESDQEADRLEKAFIAAVREVPLPPELAPTLARAAQLMHEGRRDDAEAALKGVEPWAEVYLPLNLVLMELEMAKSPDFSYGFPRIDNAYWGSLRDVDNRFADLYWEFDCRHQQSLRFTDFLYPPLPGQTPDVDDHKLVAALKLTSDPQAQEALRAFLAEHPQLTYDAVRAGRAVSPCRVLRVAQDGSGDAATIGAAVALLKPDDYKATILVEPGRYEETVSIANKWDLTIRSRVPGAAVVSPQAGSPAFEVWRMNGLVLDGVAVEVPEGGAPAVRITESNEVTLKRCRIAGPPGPALKSEGSRYVTIFDCDFQPLL